MSVEAKAKTTGTTAAAVTLTLGNNYPLKNDDDTYTYQDRYGEFKIYNDSINCNILYANKNLTQDIKVYLPQSGNSTNDAYLPWTDALTEQNSGDSTKPVYLDITGKLVEGKKYSGATFVTLNDISYDEEDVSFYAPIEPGTKDYILISQGGGSTSPSWTEY